MPVVLRAKGYVVRFFSSDLGEPPHVHVEKAEAVGKWWLDPIRMQWQYRFTASQLRAINRLLRDNERYILEQWNEFFNL